MSKLWTRTFGLFRKIPVGSACMVLFLSALFMALPRAGFVGLFDEDLYWGYPDMFGTLEYSIDGNWYGVAWHYLIYDLFLWLLYFCLLGLAVTMMLRKIGLKIRPFYSLCIIG